MRVKAGDTWFVVGPGHPLMVELTPADKQNIANMHPEARCYAAFDDADETSNDEKFMWMGSGNPFDEPAPEAERQQSPLAKEIAARRKAETRLEDAMRLVGSARLNIQTVQAILHLQRHDPHALGSNAAPGIHIALQGALTDLEKAETTADLIPF